MTDANELVRLLENMQQATQSQLSQAESGGCKLYTTGPGHASIDGTPQYLGLLMQQLNEFDKALAIARNLART
jgi:hypothetical protein